MAAQGHRSFARFRAWCVRGFTLATLVFAGTANAFETAVRPLLDSGCIGCHSNTVLSPLDLTAISHDLSDPAVFRAWERVYDRVERGDMPPPPMPPVDPAVVDAALGGLGAALVEVNLAARGPSGHRSAA